MLTSNNDENSPYRVHGTPNPTFGDDAPFCKTPHPPSSPVVLVPLALGNEFEMMPHLVFSPKAVTRDACVIKDEVSTFSSPIPLKLTLPPRSAFLPNAARYLDDEMHLGHSVNSLGVYCDHIRGAGPSFQHDSLVDENEVCQQVPDLPEPDLQPIPTTFDPLLHELDYNSIGWNMDASETVVLNSEGESNRISLRPKRKHQPQDSTTQTDAKKDTKKDAKKKKPSLSLEKRPHQRMNKIPRLNKTPADSINLVAPPCRTGPHGEYLFSIPLMLKCGTSMVLGKKHCCSFLECFKLQYVFLWTLNHFLTEIMGGNCHWPSLPEYGISAGSTKFSGHHLKCEIFGQVNSRSTFKQNLGKMLKPRTFPNQKSFRDFFGGAVNRLNFIAPERHVHCGRCHKLVDFSLVGDGRSKENITMFNCVLKSSRHSKVTSLFSDKSMPAQVIEIWRQENCTVPRATCRRHRPGAGQKKEA